MKLSCSLLTAASIFLTTSTAQLLRYCPPAHMELCYTFAEAYPNITGASNSDGNTDLFMQIQGPASKSWIALGQGSSMKGSQMFIIYANAAGNNVTLSLRLGSGHSEPDLSKNAPEVTLLAGSGIANGNMTANILCRNCNTWPGGHMNLSGAQQPWIWASKQGSPVKSDSGAAHITQHDGGSYSSFLLDLNRTTPVDTLSNPFLDLSNAQIIDVNDTSVAAYDGAAVPLHGVIMCLAFIIGFPLGAFLIRLASFRSLVWIHAALQMLSYFGAIIGLGLGIYIGQKPGISMSAFHPIAGLVIVIVLVFQPILGYVHHLRYKRQSATTPYGRVHVWFGRVMVTLGLVNGLLGLTLAGQGVGPIAAYCIVATGVGVVWVAIVFRVAKRAQNNIRMEELRGQGNEYR